jgi:hypothetical protein
MNDHDQQAAVQEDDVVASTRLSQYRFLFMVIGCITIALLLVAVSMALYTNSGAAQLDLSRPGFQSVRNQIKPQVAFDNFPSSGPIDNKTLDSFQQVYNKQAKDATSVDVFSSNVLSDQALGIDEPTPENTTNN